MPIGAKPYRVALISTKPAPDIETDLLGDALLLERKNAKPEAGALREVLKALSAHPAIAWCERMNSGAAKIGNRFVRFGWTGCPDVIGQLRDGRFIGVEVKSSTGKLRPEQVIFLERIRCAGGVAFMARDCLDVMQELDKAGKEQRHGY
ncbi:MAG: VRR-NUC domain-containing protein [Gallionella sp.]|nr:VRR-NUC domain-containing protein [Gallionella sp.]